MYFIRLINRQRNSQRRRLAAAGIGHAKQVMIFSDTLSGFAGKLQPVSGTGRNKMIHAIVYFLEILKRRGLFHTQARDYSSDLQ